MRVEKKLNELKDKAESIRENWDKINNSKDKEKYFIEIYLPVLREIADLKKIIKLKAIVSPDLIA